MRKNTPQEAASSKGLIICTASNAGLYPFPVAPVYGTAKHGVVGLVRSLARPLEKDHIQINGLAPAVLGEQRHDLRQWKQTLTLFKIQIFRLTKPF